MAPADQAAGPMQFSPPVCCQLSQAGTSSLLRIHLPPHTASVGLEFPLVPAWTPSLYGRSGARLPQLLRVSCERPHPQSHRRSDQVWGFTIFGTLTHLQCRIWFAFAVCRSLPIASFRPCRYQQRPCNLDCLPPGRGDACFFQQTGWTRHAGQTKKAGRGEPRPASVLIKNPYKTIARVTASPLPPRQSRPLFSSRCLSSCRT